MKSLLTASQTESFEFDLTRAANAREERDIRKNAAVLAAANLAKKWAKLRPGMAKVKFSQQSCSVYVNGFRISDHALPDKYSNQESGHVFRGDESCGEIARVVAAALLAKVQYDSQGAGVAAYRAAGRCEKAYTEAVRAYRAALRGAV